MKTNRLKRIAFLIAFLCCHLSVAHGQPADAPIFSDAINALESGQAPSQHSVLVYQNGEMLLERYWPGADLVYGKKQNRTFGPGELHDLRSCSKSVVGLLVGIAINEGVLPALDTPAHQLFPDLQLEQRPSFTAMHCKITLAHLLDMAVGLDWQQYKSDDHVNNESKLEGSLDAAAYVWSQPMVTMPGGQFKYNSGATALLGRAIKRRSGKSLKSYANEKLFAPLQITNWEWLSDSDRHTAAHYGLRLTPPDMLKIGRLVLQKGKWNGQQVVPASWIEVTSDHQAGSRRYRFQWWLEKFDVGTESFRVVAAHGKGGQRILVIPKLDAVVVATAGHYEDIASVAKSNEFFEQVVLPKLLPAESDSIP